MLALSGVVLITGCSREQLDFKKLKLVHKNEQESRRIALALKDSSRGVQLAIDDIDSFGGETGGWSSWILENSSCASQVEDGLKSVMSDQSGSVSRRTAAARILWLRTRNPNWLIDWFRLIKKAGAPSVGSGRRLLVSTVDLGDMTARITLPARTDLELSVEEFADFVRADGFTKTNAVQSPR